jgi:hypothetical protein
MLKRVQIKVYDNTTTHYISKIASLLILPMRSDIIIYCLDSILITLLTKSIIDIRPAVLLFEFSEFYPGLVYIGVDKTFLERE